MNDCCEFMRAIIDNEVEIRVQYDSNYKIESVSLFSEATQYINGASHKEVLDKFMKKIKWKNIPAAVGRVQEIETLDGTVNVSLTVDSKELEVTVHNLVYY